MRRGSVSTWDTFARRNSANMAQFAGSRSEFMNSDIGLNDIEYQRKGGCFLSHKKTALFIFLFVLGLIAAGFIGDYIGSLTRNRAHTVFALADEDGAIEQPSASKMSVSPDISPIKYDIELIPETNGSTISRLRGRVVINFYYNSTIPLDRLVFNAKNITTIEYKLLSLDPPETRGKMHVRRRRQDDQEALSGSNPSNNKTDANEPASITEAIIPSEVIDDQANGVVKNKTKDDPIVDTGNGTSSDIPQINSTNDVLTKEMPSNGDEVSSGNNINMISEKPDDAETEIKNPEVVVQKIPSTTDPSDVAKKVSPARDVPSGASEIHVKKNETDDLIGVQAIYLETPIERGAYSIEIKYLASVDGPGAFLNDLFNATENRWVLATQLKPVFARCLFPGFDDVKLKAKFSLSVARPKEMKVLANMPLKSSSEVANNWVMDHFEETPLLSPHNLAFVEADLEVVGESEVGDPAMAITLWCQSRKKAEASFVMGKVGQVIQNFVKIFSINYPMPKLDVLAMPGMTIDGIGSTGLVSMRESLFYITDDSPLVTRERSLKNLVRLIGEQWLGGFVNMQNWTDVWVIEGSLSYFQQLITDEIDPSFDSLSSFVVNVQQKALEADDFTISRSLQARMNPAYLDWQNPEITYGKGACLIRMLHSVVSDSAFRSGFKKFISRWGNANANTKSFWDAMSEEEIVGLPEGVTLAQAMEGWLVSSGFPVVTVTRNFETRSAVIKQTRFTLDDFPEASQQLWHIPLTYLVDGDDWSSPVKSWLQRDKEMTLKNVGRAGERTWVLFNVNQTGYYRVNYDEENWRLLSANLNDTHEKFPAPTRASLVDDVLTLARGGLTSYNTALNLTLYLREKERHMAPWVAMLRHMATLNNALYNTLAYTSFQKFMVDFITPLHRQMGLKIQEGSQLTLVANEWACLAEHPACVNWTSEMFSLMESNQDAEIPTPSYLRDTLYCGIAKNGGKREWDYMFKKITATTDKEDKYRLLSSLPCFQIPWILQKILNEVLHGNHFGGEEVLVILKAFGRNPVAAQESYKFLRRNWNTIFERFSKSYPITKAFVIASMHGVRDERDLKDLQSFREEQYDKLKIVGHSIALMEAEASSWVSWQKKQLPTIQKWLDNYNAKF